MQNLEKNARRFGLYKFNKEIIHKILNLFGKLPFIYNNNKDDIKKKKFEKTLNKSLKEFEKYFKDAWTKYFENNMLNYHNLDKFRRSNSYIENYNKHIKNILRPFIYSKKNNTIDWIYFLGLLIEEENEYREK